MKHAFKLPDVGEGIAEAEVVEYLVQKGDKVKADQPVVKIETDKAVVELPAPVTGVVVEIPFKPGDSVRVGETLLVIETEAEEAKEAEKLKEEEKPKAEEKKKEEKPPKEEEKKPPRRKSRLRKRRSSPPKPKRGLQRASVGHSSHEEGSQRAQSRYHRS